MTRDLPEHESPAKTAADAAELFRGFAADVPAESEVDDLLAGLEARLEKERGPLAWLRARPTSSRLGLALGVPTGLVLATALLAPRADFGSLPAWRVIVVVLGTAALLAASVWFGLRPLHRPAVPRWVEPLVLGSAVTGGGVLALLPVLGGVEGHGPTDWAHAMGCMYGGLIVAVPAFVIVRLLDHGGRAWSSLLAASAAGLGANGVLAMHCANDAFGHLMRGHVVVAVGFVAAVALARGAWARIGPARVG